MVSCQQYFLCICRIICHCQNPGRDRNNRKIVLSGLSLLALGMSSYMLYKLNNSVQYRKKIKKKIIEKLSDDAKEVLVNEDQIGPASRIILQTALIIGASLNIWIIIS